MGDGASAESGITTGCTEIANDDDDKWSRATTTTQTTDGSSSIVGRTKTTGGTTRITTSRADVGTGTSGCGGIAIEGTVRVTDGSRRSPSRAERNGHRYARDLTAIIVGIRTNSSGRRCCRDQRPASCSYHCTTECILRHHDAPQRSPHRIPIDCRTHGTRESVLTNILDTPVGCH